MSATDLDESTRGSIARTAQKYDQLQYESKPFPSSQPSRLGGTARFFGLDIAPLAQARVLELGCASGGNLIPHAVRYPEASFVGVDLGRAQIEDGQRRIERLGLSNIDLRCDSLTEIDESWGSFDYIICHGVYSWVPEVVQSAIFRVISERLSPVGIGCVSFNVLPGWRVLQPFRDAFLLKVPQQGETANRVAAARELIALMRAGTSDPGPYGDILRSFGERLANAPDYYLAHEYLEEVNTPCTVRDFAAAAASHGLGFLGDRDIASMVAENYGPEVVQYLQAHAGEDFVEAEQYLDILSGRSFREALLVAGDRLADVDRTTTPQSLSDLHLLTSEGVRLEQDGDQYIVSDAAGRWVGTSSRPAAEGIARLIARFPSSSTIGDCIDPAAGSDRGDGLEAFLETLHRMVMTNIVTLSSEPVRGAIGGKPKAGILARHDAAAGMPTTTNLRHEAVQLDPMMTALLPELDGTLDRAGVLDVLVRAALAGQASFIRDDVIVTEAEDIRAAADEELPALLGSMARLGILEA